VVAPTGPESIACKVALPTFEPGNGTSVGSTKYDSPLIATGSGAKLINKAPPLFVVTVPITEAVEVPVPGGSNWSMETVNVSLGANVSPGGVANEESVNVPRFTTANGLLWALVAEAPANVNVVVFTTSAAPPTLSVPAKLPVVEKVTESAKADLPKHKAKPTAPIKTSFRMQFITTLLFCHCDVPDTATPASQNAIRL
jgi:hypothetical protein